jgi:hypothetical protein
MPTLKSYIKEGFGLGVGVSLSFMLFLAASIGFVLGGYFMFAKEQAKKKNGGKPNTTNEIIGIVLMVIGCVIGLGFGGGLLFDAVGTMAE